MKVFVTGASGWIGSATVHELLGAGHQVVGLARSNDAAKRLEKAGATVVRGDVTDAASMAKAAATSEGVIHLAFQHELAFSGNFAAAAATDRKAVEAMATALEGTGRPFVLASGLFGLTPGRPTTENDGMVPTPQSLTSPTTQRRATALFVQSLFGVGVRPVVVRFSPTVHGEGDHGFMATLVKTSREKGVSAYVGEGTNRWPAVHLADAARLVCLGLEKGSPGSVLHAVGEEGIPFRDIAAAIGKNLGVPTVSIHPKEAMNHFAFLGPLVGLDGPASSAITRETLGWKPIGTGLIADLDQGHYFRG